MVISSLDVAHAPITSRKRLQCGSFRNKIPPYIQAFSVDVLRGQGGGRRAKLWWSGAPEEAAVWGLCGPSAAGMEEEAWWPGTT